MVPAPADVAATEAKLGMTAPTLEVLRARSRARLIRDAPLNQDEVDVVLLIDDRDALLSALREEAATVNVLVTWLHQTGAAPELPFSDLPADAAASADITPGPQVLRAEDFVEVAHRDLRSRKTLGPKNMNQAMNDRAALVTARAPLAAQLLHAQTRAETLAAWLARLLNSTQK
ncbi:hypothetical protein ACT4S5_12985 [Kocuria oceani]|uniref:hypothetical protein n=1 Tax=Kocuria oceani TaxID=988827 RepID=UPI0040367F23